MHVPVVFTPEEASSVIHNLSPLYSLMARLLYGSGPRLMECVGLRIKDIRTTQIYTHVLERGGNAVKSPLDNLGASSRVVSL